MHEPSGPRWPFPGTDELVGPMPPLPPARFAVGDRVTTRWGRATVIHVHDWAQFGHRAYLVKHDWSSSPRGFGHIFGEDECAPAGPEPVWHDQADAHDEAEPINTAAGFVHGAEQRSLFA